MEQKSKSKSKYLAVSALALALLIAGVGVTHAATGSGTNPVGNLVNAIAQRFNLNPSDVQQVFDQQHEQMQADMEQKFADHIAQAVSDGKITQQQADLITAKKAELQALHQSLQDKTPEERRDALKSEMDSLKTWAEENDIPLGALRQFGPGHMHRGFMGRGMMNQN